MTFKVTQSIAKEEIFIMAKKCNPPPRVRDAGRKLATSKSPAVKSEAAKKLNDHKIKNH